MSAGVCLGRRAVLGVLGGIAAAIAGCGPDSSIAKPGTSGAPFPSIAALAVLDNTQTVPAVFPADGALVVNFWASWCGPCRTEMPALQRLDDLVRSEGIRVVAVSIDRDRNLAREFIRSAKIRFPVYFDANGNHTNRVLDLRTLPETFVVDAGGVIRARISGARDWDSRDSVRMVMDAAIVNHAASSTYR